MALSVLQPTWSSKGPLRPFRDRGHRVSLSVAPDWRPRGRGRPEERVAAQRRCLAEPEPTELAHCSHPTSVQPRPAGQTEPQAASASAPRVPPDTVAPPQGWGQRRQRRPQLFFPPHPRPTRPWARGSGMALLTGPLSTRSPGHPTLRGCLGMDKRLSGGGTGPRLLLLDLPLASGHRGREGVASGPSVALQPSPRETRHGDASALLLRVDRPAQDNHLSRPGERAGRKAGGPSPRRPQLSGSHKDRQQLPCVPGSAAPRSPPPLPCRPCRRGLQHRSRALQGTRLGRWETAPPTRFGPEASRAVWAAASGGPKRLQAGGQPG